jgi:hypothetical protein
MRKSAALGLAAIALGSIAVRLSPLWSFLYWGSDTGEYFSILRALVRTAHVTTPYYGWGITYPYFPGMFFVQAGLVDLGGLDVPTVLDLLVPILGALAIAPMFLIAARIAREDRVALFAAALLAVANPHVYTTSHAAPATLGDLLVLTGLLLFLRLRVDGRSMVPLFLVTGSLVATHHLSLYLFLLMVIGAIVVRGLASPWQNNAGTRREIAFASVLTAATLVYWFGYATTFQTTILQSVNIEPWWALVVAFPLGLAVLAGIVFARKRIPWRYRPRYPGLRRPAAAYLTAVASIGVIAVVTVAVGVPGTTVQVPPAALLYFVPLVLLLSFSASGRKFLDFARQGIDPNAWLIALLLSAALGIVAAPQVLIPYRHMEYLMVPFGIFAGVGFFRLLDLGGLRGRSRAAALAVCGVLLVGSAIASIPPASALAGWHEGTLPEALDPAYWARDYASGLVATDHQGSSTVFGYGGINATWDRTRTPFLRNISGDPLNGLSNIDSPSGVKIATYVWIDQDIKAGVRLGPFEPAVPMPADVIAKFDGTTEYAFIKVFDNGYAQLYWIAWGCTTAC